MSWLLALASDRPNQNQEDHDDGAQRFSSKSNVMGRKRVVFAAAAGGMAGKPRLPLSAAASPTPKALQRREREPSVCAAL